MHFKSSILDKQDGHVRTVSLVSRPTMESSTGGDKAGELMRKQVAEIHAFLTSAGTPDSLREAMSLARYERTLREDE